MVYYSDLFFYIFSIFYIFAFISHVLSTTQAITINDKNNKIKKTRRTLVQSVDRKVQDDLQRESVAIIRVSFMTFIKAEQL